MFFPALVEYKWPSQSCWLKTKLISWHRNMSANVTATMNGTQSMSSCFNPTATRIGETFAYCLLFVVSLAGNILIGIIVYKEKALRTPINILIVNMAISDLLYPIIRFPLLFVRLNTASHWLLSSPLGQAFCKLSCFATDVSSAVSIQSLVLMAVDRFVAVVFPLRSSLISSKQCRLFILVIWIVAVVVFGPLLFTWEFVEYLEGPVCHQEWKGTFEEFSSFKDYFW